VTESVAAFTRCLPVCLTSARPSAPHMPMVLMILLRLLRYVFCKVIPTPMIHRDSA
jgi:hypothetical protein